VIRALGLDLGASGIRAYLSGDSTSVVEIAWGATAGKREQDTISLIRELAEKFPAPRCDAAYLGMSGYASLGVRAESVADAIHESFGASEVVVTSDMITSHFAHFQEESGVVVIVGTGSAAFGMGQDIHHRIDGLGATLGDYGSGYWIGHQGMRIAKRSSETVSDETLLIALEAAVGPSDDWPRLLARGELSVFDVAGLSKTVAIQAHRGERLAIQIMRDAGKMAAESALTCAARIGVSRVAYGGGVLGEENPIALESFLGIVQKVGVTAEVMACAPGQGAQKMASATNSVRVDYLVNNSLATKKSY